MMTRNEMIERARQVTATINTEAYISLVEEINREKPATTYERLRLRRNEVRLKYEREEDTTEKMRLLIWWKSLCEATEDAYRQEIKGEVWR